MSFTHAKCLVFSLRSFPLSAIKVATRLLVLAGGVRLAPPELRSVQSHVEEGTPFPVLFD